ncbi:hypothetical protein ILYODFUR_017588 [Ilyodon furcidens]|uniref:Uncharacterized protein n=1 Tax=Ilyodon furcidens TaxID=33524 RepID=A0ABV0TJG9_9TELE
MDHHILIWEARDSQQTAAQLVLNPFRPQAASKKCSTFSFITLGLNILPASASFKHSNFNIICACHVCVSDMANTANPPVRARTHTHTESNHGWLYLQHWAVITHTNPSSTC